MYIIVIGWMYVVLMMSVAEDTAVAGVMTFLLYGVLPVSLIAYLGGARRRRLRRQEKAAADAAQAAGAGPAAGTGRESAAETDLPS